MNGSDRGGARQESGVARGLAGIREVIDELRPNAPRGPVVGTDRSDVRDAVLGVLAEQPANGYRIVRILEERGSGDRTPGAGAVYPTLQLLDDEGLVTAEDRDGRKVWSLTAAGRAAAEGAEDRRDGAGPSSPSSSSRTGGRLAIVRSGSQLAQTVALAAQTVTPQQVGEVVAVLDDARRRILSVLARG